jgi:hypothetical protein
MNVKPREEFAKPRDTYMRYCFSVSSSSEVMSRLRNLSLDVTWFLLNRSELGGLVWTDQGAFFVSPFLLFPANPASDGSLVNVVVHFGGFAVGYGVAVVAGYVGSLRGVSS